MSSPVDCTHSPLSGSSGDSPPGSVAPSTPVTAATATSNPRMVHLSTSSSTPSSPQIPRQSSGRIRHGMRKMLMLQRRPTSSPITHSLTPKPTRPPSINTPSEEPLEPTEHSNRAMFYRIMRNVPGTRRMRTFRRAKRRADSKQYHSDDGYTSDPGMLREASGQEEEEAGEEEEDETDGDPDSAVVRRSHQIRELEQKLEKARQLLQEEEESDQGTEATVGSLKSRSWLNPRSKSSVEQQRKKVEKLESQLREMREGGPLESHWNPLKGSFSQLRDLMSLRKKRLHAGLPAGVEEEEEENDDDDDIFPEGVMPPVGSNEDLSVDVGEAETFNIAVDPELSLSTVQESLVAMRVSSKEFVQAHGKLREEFEEMRAHISHQRQVVQELYDKLEQERDRAERLEVQVNDITELHQNQVDDLRTQLAQMESLTMGKNQDLEDAMEECTSKVDTLDAFVHQLIDSGNKKANSVVRKPLAGALSFMLVIMAFALATMQQITIILRNKLGLAATLLVVVAAIFLYVVLR